MKTSINFKCIKEDSEVHNFRKKSYDYIRKDLTKNNEYWLGEKIAIRRNKIEQYCKEKSGRKLQKNAMPIREAVVVIKEKTTMLDLQNLVKRLENELKIRVFQIAIHKDEGHFDKESKEWKPNYHAHLVADWQDIETGKTLKHKSLDYVKMQDITAEVLGMERGSSGGKNRLEALEFKISKKEEELNKLQEKIDNITKELQGKSLNDLKIIKNDLLGFKHNDKEKTLENYEKVIKSLNIKLDSLDQNLKKKNEEVIKLKNTISFINNENSNLKIKSAKILTDKDFHAKEKNEYLNSVLQLLINETRYNKLRDPYKDRSSNGILVKEVELIASKIMEKNQIPQTTIDTLFSNEKVISIISHILKPNSINNENPENQQKRKPRFKR
ncbi:hypothetical protein [Empedobacter stercoris]|uniref:hypothetical protein n=1 Tax=Empedobacter stercoris TaxID=1628248 RepID=UPI001CE10565|nr:hypothetical protein [Empedobacter stercoris]MCA4775848.1 hypothetical protein [Empedobacter stercoris]